MPPKFKKKLSASASKDLEDTHEETKTPPPKKGKAKAADAGRPTPPKRTISAVSEGDSQKPKRGKKAKEGPYTCYKEQGSIPEPELPRRSDALPAGKKAFTLLSWNVGGLRAFLKSRKKDLENAVQLANSPAVIGIMEHKLQDSTADSEAALKELSETLPDYELACVNYSTAKKGYSGVLVLLRKEAPRPVAVTAEDLPSAAQEGRIVVLEFETVYVVVCYVPNSGDQLKRLTQRIEEWDVQLRQRLQDLGKKKHVLLMGDLNVAHQDKDIWNVEAPHVPKSAGTTNEERESFSKLIDSGFKDGFSLRHPEVLGAFTYWSVRAGNRPKNRGLRLDYAMVSDSLVSAQEHQTHFWDAFHLPAVATGDHCPVGAVLAV